MIGVLPAPIASPYTLLLFSSITRPRVEYRASLGVVGHALPFHPNEGQTSSPRTWHPPLCPSQNPSQKLSKNPSVLAARKPQNTIRNNKDHDMCFYPVWVCILFLPGHQLEYSCYPPQTVLVNPTSKYQMIHTVAVTTAACPVARVIAIVVYSLSSLASLSLRLVIVTPMKGGLLPLQY